MLVVNMQRGGDAFRDHPRAKAPRSSPGYAAVEDQLHLAGIAEVEILVDHFLEEGAASQRSVQYLSQRELSLQDRDIVKPAGLTICGSERMRQQAQPFAQQAINLLRRESLADSLQAAGISAGEKAIVERRKLNVFLL